MYALFGKISGCNPSNDTPFLGQSDKLHLFWARFFLVRGSQFEQFATAAMEQLWIRMQSWWPSESRPISCVGVDRVSCETFYFISSFFRIPQLSISSSSPPPSLSLHGTDGDHLQLASVKSEPMSPRPDQLHMVRPNSSHSLPGGTAGGASHLSPGHLSSGSGLVNSLSTLPIHSTSCFIKGHTSPGPSLSSRLSPGLSNNATHLSDQTQLLQQHPLHQQQQDLQQQLQQGHSDFDTMPLQKRLRLTNDNWNT